MPPTIETDMWAVTTYLDTLIYNIIPQHPASNKEQSLEEKRQRTVQLERINQILGFKPIDRLNHLHIFDPA